MQEKAKVDLTTVDLDGIDYKDYPDFVDAYITSAQDYEGNDLTDEELEELNKDTALVHQLVLNRMF